MKAAILLIGTELLNGGMIDTNSLYIAKELNEYGIEIQYKIIIRDVALEINTAIDFAKKNVDLIITTGGLGPTDDDITKETIAKYLGKKLVIDEEDKKDFEAKFRERKSKIETYKEVEKPEGAVSFKNDVGIAPAVFVEGIVCFPGFPNELKNMFPKFLNFYSEKNNLKSKIFIKDLITCGIGESILENTVKDVFSENDIFYEFLVKDYGTLIRMQTKIENKKKVEKIIKKLYNKISEFIIGEDEERVEIRILNYLISNKEALTLSVAESCTGGMIASKFIEVPGVSSYFKEGVVCYSNEAKMNRLNVKQETLKNFGAVSEEVAREMLEGLNTDVGISTTGIAGPGGGSDEKPVGLIYIGIKFKEKVEIIRKEFKGERNKIRKRATLFAMYKLLKMLEKGYDI